jgi:2,5-dihydroxypyridine 5,6-dioxygenase
MRQVALARGAKKIVETCMDVKENEELLIVTDFGRPFSVAQSLATAGENIGAKVTIIIMKPTLTGCEPPPPVSAAMSVDDVIIAPVTGSLYLTEAAKVAIEAGARLVTLTEVSEDILIDGAILADFDREGPRVEQVRRMLSKAKSARVTAPGGTDLTMSFADREGMKVTSLARESGTRTAAPNLEAYIAPVEDKTEGTLVADLSGSNIGLIQKPIRMQIEAGRIISIEGGAQARQIVKCLEATQHSGSYVVAELGIGLNPNAIIRGHVIEDEGTYGTAHIALGNNTQFAGGMNWAPIHFDFVFAEPTIELDGKIVMENGVLIE